MKYLISFIFAYLIGSISGAIFVSKVLFSDDIRKYGSGNAGTTNIYRAYGLKIAIIAFLIDFLKGILATYIARYIDNEYGVYIAGFAVILGHVWPIFHKFKGGKGMATSVAVNAYFDPLIALIQGLSFIFFQKVLKIVSAVSMILVVVGIILTVVRHFSNLPYLIMIILNSILVVYSHRENIKRLINGTEEKTKRL